MSIGAVTGQGCYSELTYQGRKMKVAQWYLDAMQAVSEAAFLKAADAVKMMGGGEKAVAAREVALARTHALGGFDFDSILTDGGLIDNHLMATFLYKLLVVHDATITYQLALEIVRDDWSAAINAVNSANPRKPQQTDKTGLTVQDNPAVSNELGKPSETPGETINP